MSVEEGIFEAGVSFGEIRGLDDLLGGWFFVESRVISEVIIELGQFIGRSTRLWFGCECIICCLKVEFAV